MMIPQVPNHSGQPQSGQVYQPCDPGPALGKLLTVTSTYGQEQFPVCNFVGTEGIAQVTPHAGLQIARFVDAMYVLDTPVDISSNPDSNMNRWTFMNGYYQPLLATTHRHFGPAAEIAHAKFWVPRLLEQLEAQPPVRIWGAQPRYVAMTKDSVEVQQLGRRDTVSPKDIKASLEAGDLVLRANAFYEARFILGETPNAVILMLMLKMLAAD
jgi:hypothetical protein